MVEILDCTLRDGSYVNNFGFGAQTTHEVSGALDQIGFPYIEVGHGAGLGASARGYGFAAATDLEYMKAACGNWGMFCIPGIAQLDDVRALADNGAKFVRVGCNITEIAQAPDFINLSKRLGLYVFSNLMKSYVVTPEIFGESAQVCYEAGADCVYVVDSAGSMLPDDVRKYVYAITYYVPQVRKAFHGHNNLGLAVANALEAIEAGCEVVDCTLQGIGRSGGNVCTEQFIGAQMRAGIDCKYNLLDTMDYGDYFSRSISYTSGLPSLDVMAGISGFHSSYMRRLLDVAQRRRVDPRLLMIAVTEKDKVDAPEELIEECADYLPKVIERCYAGKYYGEEQS